MRPIDDDKLVLNKITIEMILHGLERDIIRITDEGAVMGTTTPGGVVCAIGDDWFYAFGTEGENCTPKERDAILRLVLLMKEAIGSLKPDPE